MRHLISTMMIAAISLVLNTACAPNAPSGDTGGSTTGSAVILGQIVTSADTTKLLSAMSGACPDVQVSVNGSPVNIEFDSDCAFAITGVQASELVTIRIELVALGVAGTIELTNVVEDELIEILVEPKNDSLTISVERRTTPDPSDVLPELIEDNNVSIELPAGVFDQNLTVRGNKFTLVGQAGETCGDQTGWTVIQGTVVVEGNKATFRNILFAGPVEIHGNKAQFINCCFEDGLLVFGNATDVGKGKGGPKHDDGEDDNDDDD